MNNHNNHNNGEPRLDENPFDGIIWRALLRQQNGSAGSLHEHGSIWLGQECAASTLSARR